MPTSQAGSTHYTLHCATSTIRQQVWSRCSMQIIPIHTSSALRIIPTWEIIMNNLFVQPLWVKYQHLPHFIGTEKLYMVHLASHKWVNGEKTDSCISLHRINLAPPPMRAHFCILFLFSRPPHSRTPATQDSFSFTPHLGASSPWSSPPSCIPLMVLLTFAHSPLQDLSLLPLFFDCQLNWLLQPSFLWLTQASSGSLYLSSLYF